MNILNKIQLDKTPERAKVKDQYNTLKRNFQEYPPCIQRGSAILHYEIMQ